MQGLTPPEEASWTQKQYSVEEAFDMCIGFFCELWPTFKSTMLDELLRADEFYMYRFFVESICGSGFDSCGEWNDAIFRALKIPKKEQKGMMLSREELFLSTIEFCKIHNERFSGEILLLVQLIEEMIASSRKYLFEWSLWTWTIADVLSYSGHWFDWDTEWKGDGPPVCI